MTAPVTATKAVGNKVSAAWANGNVKDPLDFLLNPPRCQVSPSSTTACADGTSTLVSFDAFQYDTDNMHDPGTFPSRITFTTAGLYMLHVYIRLEGTSVTWTRILSQLRLNAGGSSSGGTVIHNHADAGPSAATNNWRSVRYSLERTFAAGEYIELFVTQTSGASRNLSGSNNITGITARMVAL